ncbi:MAG: hypothetical protein QS721_14120 [Candidatus Endonucleobacter sp. (ex Gigantidas childressi)]|nr:hypothetical protein [Candidatus Endonucleobacter sp. (ex Gigantidas childressi)]
MTNHDWMDKFMELLMIMVVWYYYLWVGSWCCRNANKLPMNKH